MCNFAWASLLYVYRSGFCTPMHVRQKNGLEMKVPDSSFTVSDVRQLVGARRVVDVMDCATQRNTVLTMKDFEEYYNNEDRNKQLNVIRQVCFLLLSLIRKSYKLFD